MTPDDPGLGSDLSSDSPGGFASAAVPELAQSAENGEGQKADGIDRKMLLALMGQAVGACVVSGCKTYFRMGLSWVGFGSAMARQLGTLARRGESSDQALRMMLDDSIAHLREVGDLSVQEASVLQRNLAELARRTRELDKDRVSEPRRYAKAKR